MLELRLNSIVLGGLLALAAASTQETVSLELATTVPSSASPPVPLDFQTFSIEFAFWADYAGNHSHPNQFSNHLFANLRQFNNNATQIIRIGGNTQDHVTYNASQEQDIYNHWNYTYNQDQPQNTTIGPTFWETFTSLDGLSLYLFELGNENDFGALSGFRPPNWTQEDWVTEWQNRTTDIQTYGDGLRFYAPSCCCFNITTAYSFFSPWTIWNSSFDYNRDGWIDEVSQHGYISGTSLNPTLQETLMNHTSVVINSSLHVELNNFHKAAGRKYTLGETNSVSGQGAYGVSDVFGSAMFMVDYELYIASKGIARMHLHQGTSYRYAAWLPVTVNETAPMTRPPYYAHAFVSKFIGADSSFQLNNIDLDSDYYSAYAAYENGTLSRFALLNLHAWDPPADSEAMTTTGSEARPNTTFDLGSIDGVESASVEIMTASGATSNTSITLAGISYDYDKAQGRPVQVGPDTVATLEPSDDGHFSLDVGYSQVVIVNFNQ